VTIDDRAGTIARPPGLRIDLGGSAKGFVADRTIALLAAGGPCAVDCGGDMRVHGTHRVRVQHSSGAAAELVLRGGATAWRRCPKSRRRSRAPPARSGDR